MTTRADRIYNLLLGLAWLGSLDRRQIQRLWFSDRTAPTVKKTLTALRHDGLIVPRAWSVRDTVGGVTRPQLARWVLTPAGHAEVRASDQYPAKPLRPRAPKLLVHDSRTTAVIVRLLELARPHGLCGVYVAHEIRLDPDRPRPICDALLIIQVGGTTPSQLVPWSSDPAIDDESRYRYAIEADNATEPLAVIRGKARAYAGVHADADWWAWWHAQYGPAPMPVWVTPSVARAGAIHQQWRQVWPAGGWAITDDAGLVTNTWRMWLQRQDHPRRELTPRPWPASSAAAPPQPARTPAVAPVVPAAPTAPATLSTNAPATPVAPRPMTIRLSAQPRPAPAPTPTVAAHRVVPPVPAALPLAAPWWQVALEGGASVLWVVGWLLWWLGWLLLLPWHLVRWANASGIENAGAMLTACYVILGVGGGLWLWLLPPVWMQHLLEVMLIETISFAERALASRIGSVCR